MQCVSEINKDRMSSGAKEVDFGMWEGKLSAEVVAKIKGVYDTSMADLESGDTYKLMTAEHDTAKATIASAFKDLVRSTRPRALRPRSPPLHSRLAPQLTTLPPKSL